jgi:hypothetical protein
MTYGWALVVIAVIIAALVFLLSQSPAVSSCTMNPATGALGYMDYAVTSDGNLTLLLRNDSGKTIQDVNFTFSGDFAAGAAMNGGGPFASAQQIPLTRPAIFAATGQAYNGVVNIAYDINGVGYTAVANCSGKTQ